MVAWLTLEPMHEKQTLVVYQIYAKQRHFGNIVLVVVGGVSTRFRKEIGE
jgi:hypothetical protein